MPNKRSGRKTKKYFCPVCEQRLWRLGTTKYHLFYRNAAEIKQNTGISSTKAKLLAVKNKTYLDTKKWIEGFFCPTHGNLWLLISLQEKEYKYRLATEKDWLQTDKTIDTRIPNPSVSEFTLRMSRKPG
jgi:hypothetical protein